MTDTLPRPTRHTLILALFAMMIATASACIFAVDTSFVEVDADADSDADLADTDTDTDDIDASECPAPSQADLCALYDLECGEYEVLDACGQTRSIDCQGCTLHDTCISGKCVCQPESRQEFCARNNAQCGITEGVDRCDNPRRIFCGECDANEACHPPSEPGQAQLCQAEEVCTPACANRESCIDEQCVCTSPSDDELCAAHIAEQPDAEACGELQLTDRCGVERTVECGSCTAEEQSCSAITNLCCVPETDVELCADNQYQCGTLDTLDSCGERRVISCGGCDGWNCCRSGSCEPRGLNIACW